MPENTEYRDSLRDKIKRRLGYPTVSVELTDDQLDDAIDDAFELIQPHIAESHFVTLPYQNQIDMSQYDPEMIVDVYKGTTSESGNMYDTISMDPTIAALSFDVTEGVMGVAEVMLRRRIVSELKDCRSYKFISPYLYVDLSYPKTDNIVVEYVPKFKSVEEIVSNDWRSILFRLSLAHSKEILGRVRSKHRVDTAPYQLDGETLVNEAQSERDEILRKLDEDSFMFFPTD